MKSKYLLFIFMFLVCVSFTSALNISDKFDDSSYNTTKWYNIYVGTGASVAETTSLLIKAGGTYNDGRSGVAVGSIQNLTSKDVEIDLDLKLTTDQIEYSGLTVCWNSAGTWNISTGVYGGMTNSTCLRTNPSGTTTTKVYIYRQVDNVASSIISEVPTATIPTANFVHWKIKYFYNTTTGNNTVFFNNSGTIHTFQLGSTNTSAGRIILQTIPLNHGVYINNLIAQDIESINFTIEAKNKRNNATIYNFTSEVNGTTYYSNITSGIITTPFTTVQIFNITTNSSLFITNISYNVNTSTNLTVYLQEININPTAPTINYTPNDLYIDTLLNLSANSTDANEDALTYYFEIYNINDSNIIQEYSTIANYTINITDAHNILRTRAKAYDGYNYSNVTEINITINNSIPITATPTFLPATAYTSTENITCYNSTTSDADLDSVSFAYLWYKNTISTNIITQHINNTNYIKPDNITCEIRVNDGYEIFSINATITISNTLHVINNITKQSENTSFYEQFYIQVNITDIDDDVVWVNATIEFPNSSIINYSTTLTNGFYITQNFTASNGTYYINITSDDGVNGTYNFTIYDLVTISPIYFNLVKEPLENGTINMPIFIETFSNGNLSFTITNYTIQNSSLFFFNYTNTTGIINNGTINTIIKQLTNTTLGNYTGNITIKRDVDNKTRVINITLIIATPLGIPFIVDKTDWSVAITSAESASKTYQINNTGNLNMTNCMVTMDEIREPHDFVDWGFYYFSLTNFSLGISQVKNLTITYINPPPAVYRGYLQVTCKATLSGNTNTLAYTNQPYLQLVSTTAPSSGGGGGGGGTTIVIVSGEGNQSLFSFETDRGSVKPSILIYSGETKKINVVLNSLTGKDLTMDVKCEGSFCPNVKISETAFILKGNDRKEFVINITMPKSITKGNYVFDIVVKESSGYSGTIRVTAQINLIASYLAKFYINNVQKGEPAYWFEMNGMIIVKDLLYLIVFLASLGVTFVLFNYGIKLKDKELGIFLYIAIPLATTLVVTFII